MSTFQSDAGIPLLTEIIELPQQTEAVPELMPESLQAPIPVPAEPLEMAAAPAPPSGDAERWEQLERSLHDRVLQHLLARVDGMLEQSVRDSLADTLQTAVEDLTRQLREGLHDSLAEAVKTAVQQEIEAARVAQD